MACKESCAHNAIQVSYDEFGFRHPVIDIEKCVDCGLCKLTCPSVNPPAGYSSEIAIAAVAENKNLLRTTASGGIATILSEYIIANGGIVYGCDGSEVYNVHHVRVTKKEEIEKLKGSKYIQSNITEVYQLIKSDLQKGHRVLFISMPCQVAGVRKYLRKDYENFFCIDILCHGASSQDMLNCQLDYYKKKYKLRAFENLTFRKKIITEKGEEKIVYGLFFDSKNQRFEFSGQNDMFTYGYANNLLFRDSCYKCKYSSVQRVSDITLGDFWNLNEDIPGYGREGASLIIPHTDKGKILLSGISSKIKSIYRPIEEAIDGNPQLIKPATAPARLIEFRKLYCKYGLIKAVRTIFRTELRNVRIYEIIKKFGLHKLLKV